MYHAKEPKGPPSHQRAPISLRWACEPLFHWFVISVMVPLSWAACKECDLCSCCVPLWQSYRDWIFLSWRRKYILCRAFFLMESILDAHLRSWEIVDPRNLRVSTADAVLLSMVMGAVLWGSSWNPHFITTVLSGLSSRLFWTPEGQLFSLPSVCRLVTWICDPLTGGNGHSELGEFGAEDIWDDGVKCQVEVHEQDPCILYVPGESRCCRMYCSPELTAYQAKRSVDDTNCRGLVMSFRWANASLSKVFMTTDNFLKFLLQVSLLRRSSGFQLCFAHQLRSTNSSSSSLFVTYNHTGYNHSEMCDS